MCNSVQITEEEKRKLDGPSEGLWLYADVAHFCAHMNVLMTDCHCDEVSMTLWLILLQHNPFLTMLVDPNGLTQDWWCERDAVPQHKY